MVENAIDWSIEPDLDELTRLHKLGGSEARLGLEALAERKSIGAMIYVAYGCNQHRTPRGLAWAIYWYSKAASLGSQFATYMLGKLLLEQGDLPRARAALERSAALGYNPALYRLGRAYLNEGGAENRAQARSYFEIASAAGHLLAKRDLAFLLWKHASSWRERIFALRLFAAVWAHTPEFVMCQYRLLKHNIPTKEKYFG